MATEGAVLSISGGMLRSASLCPRLAVHKAWYSKEDVKVGAAGGEVVNGNLFHAQIIEKILKDLASGEKPALRRVVEANWDSQEELRKQLWRVFSHCYMAPALQETPTHLGNNPSAQISAMTQGLGELAGLCAELLFRSRDVESNTRRFLPPEGTLEETMEIGGQTIELKGNYDALWFDPVSNEFILIDFKCKTAAEFPSDLHQLTCYSWLINRRSKCPVRGVLVYVQPEPDVRLLSASDLAKAYSKSEQLVRFVASLLQIEKDSGVEIPQTAVPDLCKRCPLDERCDQLYGQRKK